MDKLQVAAFALIFVLFGSLAYYSYYNSGVLASRNSAMQLEIVKLDANITQLSAQLAQTSADQAALSSQQSQFDLSLSQQGSQESSTAQQVATLEASLRSDSAQLSSLGVQLAGVEAGNITALQQVSSELQAISTSLTSIQSSLSCVLPSVFLRTQGTALASFVDGPQNISYLRLTETGPNSLVESSIGSEAFNASVPGASAEWYADANPEASLAGHTFWPMVLENSPGGTNAIEFEDNGGDQVAAVTGNGTRVVQAVSWDPSVPNLFGVVVTLPGQQIKFYINGNLVATLTAYIPTSQFLIYGAEVKGGATTDSGIATVDTYGGMLGTC
jgi:hypothetical protein